MPIGDLLRVLVRRYAEMVPGVVVAACILALAPHWMAAAGLLAITSALHAGAAARMLGIREEPLWDLCLLRGISHAVRVLALLFVLGALTLFPILVVVLWSGRDTTEATAAWALGLGGVLALAALSRLWPILALNLIVAQSEGWTPQGGQAKPWIGPGLMHAWRLTRRRGSLARHGLPVTAMILGLGAFHAAVLSLAPRALGLAATAIVVAAGMPLVFLLAASHADAARGEPGLERVA